MAIKTERRFEEFEFDLPTGGLVFEPSGFISSWSSGLFYRVYTDDEGTAKEADSNVLTVPTRTGRYAVYFTDEKVARDFTKENELGQFPNLILRMTTELKNTLNIVDKTRFADVLAYDLRVSGLGSKERHLFHLMFLPSSVHAVALQYGADVPPMDFSALEDRDTIYDDSFRFSYIGNPDASPDAPDGWMNSCLGKQRIALWRALGEEDVRKFALPGHGVKRFQTEAEDLVACLKPSTLWNNAWVRVVNLPDPGPNASYEDTEHNTRRRQTPVVYARYFDKAEAEKAATELRPSTGETISTSDKPALPEAWRGEDMEERWIEELTRLVQDNAPTKIICEQLECSATHVKEWKAQLGF